MSTYASLKRIIPKRKYRERSQPEWRKGKGFLEKKQDYVKRAKRHHKTEDQLNKLRLKSNLKNDQEFSFKMINSRMQVCLSDLGWRACQDRQSEF